MEGQLNLNAEVLGLLDVQREHLVQTVTDGAGRQRTFAANGLKEVTDRRNRSHEFLSLESLLAFAKSEADQELAMLCYNEKGVSLVLDRKLMLDESRFEIKPSKDLNRWLGQAFDQKLLIEHLQTWGHLAVLEESDLDSVLLALHGLTLSKTVNYQSKHQDGRTVQLNYTLDGGDPKSAKIPREWHVQAPVHEGGPVYHIPLLLDLQMPDSEKQKPVFRFTCPTLSGLRDKSLGAIADTVKEELPGFLVLNANT